MSWRWIVPFGLSVVLAAIGLALRGSPGWSGVGVALGGAGVSIGGVIGALLLSAWVRRREVPFSSIEARRVRGLVAELGVAAEAVDRIGLLALADARVTVGQELFARGGVQAINAMPIDALREDLQAFAARESERLSGAAQRRTAMVRVGAVLCLGVAFGLMLQNVAPALAGNAINFSDARALSVLLLVYSGCMLVVIGQDVSRRAALRVREQQLVSAMIIEAMLQFRSGAPRAAVREAVERLISPDMPDAPAERAAERVAA